MRQTKLFLFIFAAIGLVLAACSKDELKVKTSQVGVALTNPAGLTNPQITDIAVEFKEVNSGVESKFNLRSAAELSNLTLPEGSYNVNLEGTVTFGADNDRQTSKIRGYKQGIIISGGEVKLNIPLFLYNVASKFVFQEIFFTGTVTKEGKQYNGDKYFVIYNNSEDTLYADGLVISEAQFLTTTKRNYIPNIMGEAFTAGSIVMIPGTGKQYPILPGKGFTIANNAINHLEYNSNSFDLTSAEFELTLVGSINVDNPNVPDLINLNGNMTMHNRGFKTYVIARFPQNMTIDAYKAANYYEYKYLNSAGDTTKQNAYKIPNAWIMDAVNLSVETNYEWILTDPSLDMGWSYCGKVDSDKTRYGKAVRRKELLTNPDGRVVLKDNNNSTLDFDPEVTAKYLIKQ
ncbi:uncharacterized protein DUF4876 [Chitinophaga skermanii]|uniref:Uncharacterized protein DUF4876 n=1 Tax=Chitinophaga skermanii TaxID=331697 RepID=A0A327R2L8_9BACT|nr:DUF4876 domain-containing protein [Chitinophaga skermanii]RAJ10871.1 uncharacterized protein DUF4876 [Chitinophaga skermanii]